MSIRKLHLEDLAVGQVYESGRQQLDVAAIKRFATEYDPQPFHLDEDAAKGGFFGGLAASGWHTAAITMRLLIDGGLPIAGGFIGSGGELRWPKPVRPGDTLRVRTEVLAITPSRSKPGRSAVDVRIVTLNQHDEVVQTFTPKLVVAASGASGSGEKVDAGRVAPV